MNIIETYIGKKIDNINILNIDDAVKYKIKTTTNTNTKIVFITGVTGQDGSHIP